MPDQEPEVRIRRRHQRNPLMLGALAIFLAVSSIIAHNSLRERQVQKPELPTPPSTPTSIHFDHIKARKAMIWNFPGSLPSPLPYNK